MPVVLSAGEGQQHAKYVRKVGCWGPHADAALTGS